MTWRSDSDDEEAVGSYLRTDGRGLLRIDCVAADMLNVEYLWGRIEYMFGGGVKGYFAEAAI